MYRDGDHFPVLIIYFIYRLIVPLAAAATTAVTVMTIRSMFIMTVVASAAAISIPAVPGTAAASLRRPCRTAVTPIRNTQGFTTAAAAVCARNCDGCDIITMTSSARNRYRTIVMASAIIVKVYIKRCISITAIPV